MGLAFTRLAEDHLYWLMVASRWLDDNWWPNVVDGFFGTLPGIIRPVITGIARRQISVATFGRQYLPAPLALSLARHQDAHAQATARTDHGLDLC